MVSAGCRLAGGQKRDQSARRNRPITTTRLAGGQKRDHSARRNRPITTTRLAETDQSRPLVRPPSTLSRLASGIRSSFSQFFCPPLRFFYKKFVFLPSTALFYKKFVFLPSTLSRWGGGWCWVESYNVIKNCYNVIKNCYNVIIMS